MITGFDKTAAGNAAEKVFDVLRLEADAVARAAGRLSGDKVSEALDILGACGGKIVVTGVGKSGVIAEKIAQTFTSTGTMAVYLAASDALHGGLGVVTGGDVVLALTNSGETDEILAILPAFKGRAVPVVAIVGNVNSTLAKQSDVALDASVDVEACPLNLAPTASTTVALAIGDALAMALMEMKGLTPEQFAANHPAGRLGKRLTVRVVDLMHAGANVSPDAQWLDVVKAISQHALGAVNVIEDGVLVGIVTDGDLRRTIERTAADALSLLAARDMMTPQPITTSPDALAFDALQTMEDRPSQISVLPVVDAANKCVGLLRLHDIVRSGL